MPHFTNQLVLIARLAVPIALRIVAAFFILLLAIGWLRGNVDWVEILILPLFFGAAYILGVFLLSLSKLREAEERSTKNRS